MINDYCFLDLETTGTDVNKDRIVEISIIKIESDSGDRKESVRKINPTIPIPKAATDVHGITDEMVKDSPTFKQIARSLLTLIQGCNIIGYNSISYDVPLLYNEFVRSGLSWRYQDSLLIDVQNIYKIKESRTLSDAVKFYCNVEHTEAHGSLGDCQATEKVYLAQLEKYNDLKVMNEQELSLFSNYGKKIVDISGKFIYDDKGEIIFNFGPNKGKVAKLEKSFLQWMLKATSDFSQSTKEVAQKLLYS